CLLMTQSGHQWPPRPAPSNVLTCARKTSHPERWDYMRRREFIAFLGGAAAAWPLTARAQQPARPVIGFLNGRSPTEATHLVAAFLQGLKETGFVDGQNVTIEYLWANGEPNLFPALVTDLINRQVALIVTSGGIAAAIEAKKRTTSIPIVFV